MRLNKQNQGTLALFIWFAFLNTHLMLLVLSILYWRLNNPKVPFSDVVLWDPAIANDAIGFVGLMLAALAAGIGMALGLKFFSDVQAGKDNERVLAPTKLVIAYAMLDGVGMLGLCLGILKGNVLLGVPFLAVAAILISLLFPHGARFPSSGGK